MNYKAIIQVVQSCKSSEIPFDRGAPRISRSRWLAMVITIVVLFGGFAIAKDFDGAIGKKRQSLSQKLSPKSTEHTSPQITTSKWVRISYNDLFHENLSGSGLVKMNIRH